MRRPPRRHTHTHTTHTIRIHVHVQTAIGGDSWNYIAISRGLKCVNMLQTGGGGHGVARYRYVCNFYAGSINNLLHPAKSEQD